MAPKGLILLVLFAACPAVANTIVITGVDTAVGYLNSLWIYDNGTNSQVYFAGGIDVTVDGYSRLLYCVDLDTNINVPGTYSTTIDFTDSAALQRVGWLMQNYWPSAIYTGAALQVHGAAFQLAIWDIITDNGDGFGTTTTHAGKVSQSTNTSHTTDSAVLAAAILYETESVGKSSNYGVVYHNTSSGTTVQTLMGPTVTDNGPSPIPEPSAIILIFSGLALIGLSRLRRNSLR